MTRMVYVGVAATVLLACAPTVAQEKAEAPDASVVNEATAPTAAAMMETDETTAATTEAEAMSATANDAVVCKRGKTERHVNVVSPGSQGRLCEVHYAKPTEGVENRVLWFATSDKNFCDERANALMARLTNAGWSCENPDGTAVSIEASTTPEPAAETVSAPESAPQPVEADHPSEPEEPADAPEGAGEPAEGDEPGDDQ